MKKIVIAAALAGTCAAVSGCATKRYPIAVPVSAAEAAAMDCDDLRLEIIRGEQVQAQIATTAQTDWRSVAGFLGDYGIGNAMAKSEADKAITARIQSLRAAQAQKNCQASASLIDRIEAWSVARVGDLIGSRRDAE